MTGLLLALAASCAWGLSDFLGGNRTRTTALAVVLAGSQFAGLATLGVFLVLAPGGAAASLAGLGPWPLLLAVGAGACGVTSLGLLYLAMSRRGTAVVAPVAAGAAVLPVAVALVRGESLGARGAAGIVLALAGTFLAASSSGSPGTAGSAAGTAASSGAPGRDVVALAAGVGSALGSGGFLTLMRYASEAGDPLAATLANRLTACALVGAWLLGRLPDLRRTGAGTLGLGGLVAVLAVGAADAAAEVCFALASRNAPQSVVAPLSSLYPAVAVVLALVLLRERPGRRGGVGVVSAVAGVALLA